MTQEWLGLISASAPRLVERSTTGARPAPDGERRARSERTTSMIGLVIVTHGRLAEEFVLAMEHLVGPQA